MFVNLSTAKIRKFESHIKKSYEGVIFELMVTHNPRDRRSIELTWIIVEDREQGTGSAIMRELCEFADHHSAEIRLKPASKDDYAAITSRERLIRFYNRFEFVMEKQKPDAIEGIPILVRKPVVAAV